MTPPPQAVTPPASSAPIAAPPRAPHGPRALLTREFDWIGSPFATVAIVLLVVLMIVIGAGSGSYYQTLIGIGAAYLIAGLGYSVALQFAGQFLFCQAAFMAIGAYAFAMLEPHTNEALAFAGAAVASGLVGLVLGIALLRVQDIYLAIVTLAFGQTVLLVANVWPLTGGEDGIAVTLNGENTYVVASIAVGVVLLVVTRVLRSRVGRELALTRESPPLGRACGVKVDRLKVLSVGTAGLLGGIGGVLLGGVLTFITPSNFPLTLTLLLLAAIVIGGRSIILTLVGVGIMSALYDLLPSTGNAGEYISAAVLFSALTVQNNPTMRGWIMKAVSRVG
jgi:branched-chain amino acid transport system permease protein